MKILVINPGSTSTKLAVYDGLTELWRKNIQHPIDELSQFHHPLEQHKYRTDHMYSALAEADIPVKFDAVIGRGGLLKPTPGGVYAVDERIKHDLINAEMEHVCNLGALMADDIASECGCPAFIADPVVVDELIPEARLSGIPGIERRSVFHALNSKAVARRYAASVGRSYEDMNFIVVHLGGGISVAAHRHGRVIDVNNALDGEGPFSPERAGTVPAGQLAELCFSGKYTLREIKKLISGQGGLAGHLGTHDMKEIAARAADGDEPYRSILESMIYTVAKEVGARYVSLHGRLDAIIITGGIAHSQYCVDRLSSWIDYLAPIIVRPGEDEVEALAFNAHGAMTGTLPVSTYSPT